MESNILFIMNFGLLHRIVAFWDTYFGLKYEEHKNK